MSKRPISLRRENVDKIHRRLSEPRKTTQEDKFSMG